MALVSVTIRREPRVLTRPLPASRSQLPRTREEYERHIRLHVKPYLGEKPMNQINAQGIRTWRSDRLNDNVGHSTVAKTYRILHAIFATAVDDDLMRRNPCRIKGAGHDKAEERPTATLDQVFGIAEAIQPRYRLMILLAAFAQLRFGELVALRRNNIDLDKMELRVRRPELPRWKTALRSTVTPNRRRANGPSAFRTAYAVTSRLTLCGMPDPAPPAALLCRPTRRHTSSPQFQPDLACRLKGAKIRRRPVSTFTTCATQGAPGPRRAARHSES